MKTQPCNLAEEEIDRISELTEGIRDFIIFKIALNYMIDLNLELKIRHSHLNFFP